MVVEKRAINNYDITTNIALKNLHERIIRINQVESGKLKRCFMLRSDERYNNKNLIDYNSFGLNSKISKFY